MGFFDKMLDRRSYEDIGIYNCNKCEYSTKEWRDSISHVEQIHREHPMLSASYFDL